jgi:hypothetical protein
MRRLVVIASVVGLIIVASTSALLAAANFTDVPGNSTFARDIAWLAETGITRGCNPPANDAFCPDRPVTRAEMAAFLHRFDGYLAKGGQSGNVVYGGRASQFARHVTEVASGESIELASIVLDPSDGGFAALNGSAFSLAVASNVQDPDTGQPVVNSFGWLQRGGTCPVVPLDSDGRPIPPDGYIRGSEFPFIAGAFIPVSAGSVSSAVTIGDEPLEIALCASVQAIFGGEVAAFGSAGLVASQFEDGSISISRP